MDERVKFAVAFQCPNCGQKGARHGAEGPAANGEPLIVCDFCDEMQPD